MPFLASITIYPIKSLDPCEVQEASLTAAGSLLHDREYCIQDMDGKRVNGKRSPAVHGIRSRYDPAQSLLQLSSMSNDHSIEIHLPGGEEEAGEWLSRYLSFPVRLAWNANGGYPDDTDAHGPTVVGRETLEEVARWFHGITREEIHRRFRPNLEIAGVPPFWEDRLFAASGEPVRFRIGRVEFDGTGPCARCPVPTRNPDSGASFRGFQLTFTENRKRTLPAWAPRERFDHFYRLSVNTRVAPGQDGELLRIGDEVVLF